MPSHYLNKHTDNLVMDLSDDKSTLVQVTAWCRQAASRYLIQCWPNNKLWWNKNQSLKVFIQRNAIGSVICKMAAIFFSGFSVLIISFLPIPQLVGAAFGAAGQRCMALSTAVWVGSAKEWIPEVVERAKKLKISAGEAMVSRFLWVRSLLPYGVTRPEWTDSFWPSDTIWRQRSVSTLAQVMACCLTAPNHYLNQCWLIIS